MSLNSGCLQTLSIILLILFNVGTTSVILNSGTCKPFTNGVTSIINWFSIINKDNNNPKIVNKKVNTKIVLAV